MAALPANDLNSIKKQAITDFNQKIDSQNMKPKQAREAKASFKETVDPGFFGKVAKLGRASQFYLIRSFFGIECTKARTAEASYKAKNLTEASC